jgi:DNA-binding transcriptional MerR regulator
MTPATQPPVGTGMTVSPLAAACGVTADTVRFYERVGLLPPAARDGNGYRRYGEAAVERLRFIRRSQQFGLSLDDIRELLTIRDGGRCPCGHANDLLVARLRELDEQIATLTELRGDIATLLTSDVSEGLACGTELVSLTTRNEEEHDDGWV